jgi:hypothetical protein
MTALLMSNARKNKPGSEVLLGYAASSCMQPIKLTIVVHILTTAVNCGVNMTLGNRATDVLAVRGLYVG